MLRTSSRCQMSWGLAHFHQQQQQLLLKKQQVSLEPGQREVEVEEEGVGEVGTEARQPGQLQQHQLHHQQLRRLQHSGAAVVLPSFAQQGFLQK